jgi:hypothetical protein
VRRRIDDDNRGPAHHVAPDDHWTAHHDADHDDDHVDDARLAERSVLRLSVGARARPAAS